MDEWHIQLNNNRLLTLRELKDSRASSATASLLDLAEQNVHTAPLHMVN